MTKPPDDLGYTIDETIWNKEVDPLKKENQTKEILNEHITQVMQQ
jgi:hypothetical protein